MLILGIDPGTTTTGYGAIRVDGNSDFEVLDFGLIETEKNGESGKRFLSIYKQSVTVFKRHIPDVLAIERIFFANNAKTAINVGQAQGVILYAAAKFKIHVVEYAPATIKKMITGSGRADKKMVQQALRKVLGAKVRSWKKGKTHFDNAADALAIALTHAFNLKTARG